MFSSQDHKPSCHAHVKGAFKLSRNQACPSSPVQVSKLGCALSFHPNLIFIRSLRNRVVSLRRLSLSRKEPSEPGPPSRILTEEDWLSQLRMRCNLYSTVGPRHLCQHGCFYREFAPAREALRLRNRVLGAGMPCDCLAGWSAELAPFGNIELHSTRDDDGIFKANARGIGWRVIFVSGSDCRRLGPGEAFRAICSAAQMKARLSTSEPEDREKSQDVQPSSRTILHEAGHETQDAEARCVRVSSRRRGCEERNTARQGTRSRFFFCSHVSGALAGTAIGGWVEPDWNRRVLC